MPIIAICQDGRDVGELVSRDVVDGDEGTGTVAGCGGVEARGGGVVVGVVLVVVRIGSHKARGGGVVGGVVVVDCTVTWSDDELHKVSGP